MSLCDTCRLPGRCCTGFGIGVTGATALEALVQLATLHHGEKDGRSQVLSRGGWHYQAPPGVTRAEIGLPFLPFNRNANGTWGLWCPLLGRDGRCTDYEHRPALCRDYQPGQDALCAEFVPPEPLLEVEPPAELLAELAA